MKTVLLLILALAPTVCSAGTLNCTRLCLLKGTTFVCEIDVVDIVLSQYLQRHGTEFMPGKETIFTGHKNAAGSCSTYSLGGPWEGQFTDIEAARLVGVLRGTITGRVGNVTVGSTLKLRIPVGDVQRSEVFLYQ